MEGDWNAIYWKCIETFNFFNSYKKMYSISRGEFLLKLQDLVNEKQNILNDEDLENLKLKISDDQSVPLEDLGLTFQYSPSSRIFGLDEGINLIPDGDNEIVTIHNLEDYLSLTLDFTLNKGIKKQMDAFKSGFNLVFPMEKLAPFSPYEVKSMLCGDQSPVFTKEDIIRFTEPKLGYTRESPAFLKFVNVLVDFTDAERKAFLQFTTGCSSLPPGMYSWVHINEFKVLHKTEVTYLLKARRSLKKHFFRQTVH